MLKAITAKLALNAMNRRGMSHPVVLFILSFFGVGLLAAIYVIVLAALRSSTTDADAIGVVNNTIELFTNFTGQFGTIGTITGVLILLVALAAVGIGGWMAYQRYGR